MTDLQRILLWEQLVNAGLFNVGVIFVGTLAHNWAAPRLALASIGIGFLSYFCQFLETTGQLRAVPGSVLGIASIILGAAAGINLLVT